MAEVPQLVCGPEWGGRLAEPGIDPFWRVFVAPQLTHLAGFCFQHGAHTLLNRASDQFI